MTPFPHFLRAQLPRRLPRIAGCGKTDIGASEDFLMICHLLLRGKSWLISVTATAALFNIFPATVCAAL